MKFSYSAVWEQTVRMLRAHSSLLLAVAGAFLFLPSLIFSYLAPMPGADGGTPTAEQAMAWYQAHMWWFVLVATIGFIGNLAIMILVLDETRPTVGASITGAFRLLWVYFNVSILIGITLAIAFMLMLMPAYALTGRPDAAAGIAFALMLVPGLYVMGRVAIAGPVLVAEPKRGAVATIKRCLELTRGRGWAIIGLLLLIMITFMIVNLAITVVLGSVFMLVDRGSGGPGIGAFLSLVLSAGLSAVLSTVVAVLLAAIYRNLTTAGSVERVFD